MDLRDLEVLFAVADHGSFAAAARALRADPSVVSRTVATLEAQLQTRLFQRTTRRLALTEAGARYCERVRPLHEEMVRAGIEAREQASGPAGIVRVTASVAFGYACVVPLLQPLRERYPHLGVDLVLSDLVLDLGAERIDVALRLAANVAPNLVGGRIANTRYFVVASPAYLERRGTPSQPQDLSGHDCLRSPTLGYRDQWKFRGASGKQAVVLVDGSITTSNALALRKAVLDGLGPALLPDWLVGEDMAAGRLVDLFPAYEASAANFDTGVWVLYVSRKYVPHGVRAFVDFVKERFAQGWPSEGLRDLGG